MVWNRLFKLWQPRKDSFSNASTTTSSTTGCNNNINTSTAATASSKTAASATFTNICFSNDAHLDPTLTSETHFRPNFSSQYHLVATNSFDSYNSNASDNSNQDSSPTSFCPSHQHHHQHTQAFPDFTWRARDFVTSNMSRHLGQRKKMSRRMRSEFQPLPQDDDDYDSENDNTEEDILADVSDEDCHATSSFTLVRGRDGYRGVCYTGPACPEVVSEASSIGGKPVDKKERVIATPWGAAWIGKRKKGVTYCTPSKRKDSDKKEEDGAAGVTNKAASAFREVRKEEKSGLDQLEDKLLFDDDDDDDDDDYWNAAEHICDVNCPLINCGECPTAHSPGLSSLSGQRRSSFTSSSSRESTLSSLAANARRFRPVASLSIEDLPSESQAGAEMGGPGPSPLKSPGLLSTASMWSTSDLNQAMAKGIENDSGSHVGTTSLSNVSGSFSERLHELVRAFSSRTQRTREKISQPPTPSSDSDYDAKSAVSTIDEPSPQGNTRHARSFFPMGSRQSDQNSEAHAEHLVGVWHCRFKAPKWLSKLRFPSTIEPHSKTYVAWLLLVTFAFMYNATVIPLRAVFPYQTPQNVKYWFIADYVSDFIYLMDIVVFKVRLRFASHGIVECDHRETRKHYMRKWMFKFDILSLAPLDLLYLIKSVGVNPWLRLNRLLKIQTFWEFFDKCDQTSRTSAHAIRIFKTMTYMLFLIHIETCGYYAMSVYEGIGINEWVYNGQGNAYIRCFYLAAKTATSIGNNPKPTNQLEFGFMTLYWLSGVFVFALLIGQIRDIVEAAGMVKDNYRKKMDACLWYMQSINLPNEMQNRVREWFLYNWEQQKTIDERSLVSALPKKLQTDLAINVHFQTLSKVQLFQDCEKNLLFDLVLKLKPILFLPGDYICKKGEVGKEMYIVTQGQVEVVGGDNDETVLATLHEGSVFGEISLLAMSGRGNRRTADVRSKGYTNVFTLSKHDFEEAMLEYPEAQSMLKKRAKKLLKANAKMEKKNKSMEVEQIIKTPTETPKLLRTVIQVMDPDSKVVKRLGSSLKSASSCRHFRRSHSHRLSPSPSNVHHLTPPRSHSYRLANRTSSTSLDAITSNQRKAELDKAGLDSDEQEDPMFDESSEDLSEVLHEADAISSFDEDDENDNVHPNQAAQVEGVDDEEEEELLIIEQYEGDADHEKQPDIHLEHRTRDTSRRESHGDRGKEGQQPGQDAVQGRNGEKQGGGIEVRKDESIGDVSERDEGRSQRSKDESIIPSEDSQDSGLPDVQRSDSRSSSGKKETGPDSRRESKTNSRNSGRCSRCSVGSNTERPGSARWSREENMGEGTISFERERVSGDFSKMDAPKQISIEDEDVMENYIEKQRRSLDRTKLMIKCNTVFVKEAVTDRTLPQSASCTLEVQAECGTDKDAPVPTRVRKLSVVTPPHSPIETQAPKAPLSPKSPREREPGAHLWSASGRAQITSLKENGANILRPLTPVETIQIRPLSSIDAVSRFSRPSSAAFHRISSSNPTPIPSLTNGLEGCCGSGPLVDIPPENRVICAVEIHRQKTGNPNTTTDIHGHTETSL